MCEGLHKLGMASAVLAVLLATAAFSAQNFAHDAYVHVYDTPVMLKYLLLWSFASFALLALIAEMLSVLRHRAERHSKQSRHPN